MLPSSLQMADSLKTFYNKYGYWRRKLQRLDYEIAGLLAAERRGAAPATVRRFFELGKALLGIGVQLEDLLREADNRGVRAQMRDELRDCAAMVETLSEGLKRAAERRWDQELPTFPLYRSLIRASVMDLPPSEAIEGLMKDFKLGETG